MPSDSRAQPPDLGDAHSSLTVPQRVAASSLGGLLTSVTMTPFDVVKTRLQAQARPGPAIHPSRCFLYCNGLMDLQLCAVNAYDARSAGRAARESLVPNFCRHQYYTAPVYQGSWDAALKIGRSEGLLALWRGLSASLALTVPGTVIYFTTLDLLKWRMGYRPWGSEEPGAPGGVKHWVPPLAAGLARVTAVLCLSPLELARTKMQAEGLGWSAIGRAAAAEVRRAGPLTLWRGLPPTLMRDVPFSAIYWLAYDGMRARLFAARAGTGRPVVLTGSEAAGFGCAAGALAGLVTHPFDVLKTHRQVEFATGARRAPGTLASVRQLAARRLLFTGLAPRLLKVVPASAVMVASFELLKNEFSERNRLSLGFVVELDH